MKSAIVFGGPGAIGSKVARDLKKDGYGVIVADVVEPKRDTGDFFVTCDVTNEVDIKRAILYVQEKFGSLDVVINCHGMYIVEPLETTELHIFQKMIDVNLKSAFLIFKSAIPIMKWQKRGYIISIASMAGLRGKRGQVAYCASKFGLVGLTEAIYEELKGTNVRVSVVCPSSVDTTLLHKQVILPNEDIEQLLKPEDVSRVIMALVNSNPRVRQKVVPIEIAKDIDKLERKRLN
jgi:NAD(P)-dependent dehydrogenase (short-subunit alcohol dehydrogenase family)